MTVEGHAGDRGVAPVRSRGTRRAGQCGRVHGLILRAYPEADVVLSYGMPTYRVGERRLHVGVWRHGVSVYGWDKDAGADLLTRHPRLLGGKGTIRLRSTEAQDVTDDELSDLVRASLGPGAPH